jgi:hypothetical protein
LEALEAILLVRLGMLRRLERQVRVGLMRVRLLMLLVEMVLLVSLGVALLHLQRRSTAMLWVMLGQIMVVVVAVQSVTIL